MKIIFDIGGTNMRISSTLGGKLGDVRRMLTPQDLASAKELMSEIIKELSNGEKIESIVGGVPGSIQDGTIIDAPNLKNWDGFNIKSYLQDNFCEAVFIYNDADLAGVGESLYGAGQGSSIVAYIGVGTGIGGVRVVNGMIDANKHGFEPGHHILDAKEGKTFEDLVSGRAILQNYKKPAEELGQAEIKKLSPVLAAGLYNVVRFWSPDVLVVGGSLVSEETGFRMEDIKKSLNEINKDSTLPNILKAELGDSSGLYGAIAMTERMKI